MLKPLIGEARPYVVALTDNDPARLHLFYSVPRAARANTVSYYYAQSPTTPPSYLVAHRASETGYSFPSGHSTFAATWALLFAGIIGFANRRRSGRKKAKKQGAFGALFHCCHAPHDGIVQTTANAGCCNNSAFFAA